MKPVMGKNERRHGPATQVALDHLSTLKLEHQHLLNTLLADTGMASATLESLVEHLLEEEGPQLRDALTRAKAGASVQPPLPSIARTGTTVGSLRPSSSIHAAAAQRTVGSLRK
jgi:hypothetical protein